MTTCPKCGCQLFPPFLFMGSERIHDVEKCGGIYRTPARVIEYTDAVSKSAKDSREVKGPCDSLEPR